MSVSDYTLRGPIPPEFGDLTALQTLDLSGNELTGSIPPELGGLTHLKELYLYINQLTGSIPPQLGGLTNLSILSISRNQFTGSLPSELGGLTNLDEFYLQSNPLSGSLPMSLVNLSLSNFRFDNTQLCAPADEAFQAWLQAIPNLTSTGITCLSTDTEAPTELPSAYTLEPNYPNPFNPSTTIRYGLPKAAWVRLVVYDALGRRVQMLVDARQPPGWHKMVFDANHLPNGVYFYRLEAGSFQASGQMLLVR